MAGGCTTHSCPPAACWPGVSAYLSVRFLLRYLRTRTLTPFGIYCLLAGVASFVYLGVIQ